MSRMIYTLPFVQMQRKIKEQFKINPSKSILGLFTVSILLFLIAFIVREFLSPILEIIYSDSQKSAEIQFFRSMNLAVSVMCSLVLILSIFMGMQEQKEFDKMMLNYQISQFKRNMAHFIFEFISNLSMVMILVMVLMFPSIKTQEINFFFIFLMFFLQASFVLLTLLCLERIIRIILPKLLWQIGLIIIQIAFYYQVYQNLDKWHVTNFFNFIIGDRFQHLYLPVLLVLLLLYILNFKSYKEGIAYRFIRFRLLPNNLIFKNFKELIRHKESTLNSFILMISILLIKIFKPNLLEEETLRMALISLTGMQSIYVYAYFKESLVLYQFSYQSSLKIYTSYLLALIGANIIQFGYILILIPKLLEDMSSIFVTLILVNSIFITLGKYFPLQEKYGFNTSFQLALIVLLIVPMVIVLFQIKKELNLSQGGFMGLQGLIAFVIQVVLLRKIHLDLTL